MKVTIERFRVQWDLADRADATLAEAVLGRLVDDVLEDALTDALDQVAGADLVAVRTVAVPPLSVRRPADAATWGQQVAAATVSAVAAGGEGVVRYRSVRAATADIVVRVARGDLGREWAWRQLGLWRSATPASAVTALLTADPSGAVPVLDAAGRWLPEVLALLGSAALLRVAGEAWALLGTRLPAPSAFASCLMLPAPADHAVKQPGALLAARGGPLGSWLLAKLAPVGAPSAPYGAAASMLGEPSAYEQTLAVAALLVAYAAPEAVVAGRGHDLVTTLLMPLPVLGSPDEPGGAVLGAPNLDLPQLAVPIEPRPASPAGVTRWGGLPFCLHLLRPLLDPTLHDPTLPARPSPDGLALGAGLVAAVDREGWPAVLHQVGVRLLSLAGVAPVDPADPALLAWCGRGPSASVPEGLDDEGGLHGELDVLARGLVVALRSRLGGRPIAALTDDLLLNAVVRRTGRVAADPGWIEVVLALDEVSVDLRAAGLDLDPGWLPALGSVMRFRYE